MALSREIRDKSRRQPAAGTDYQSANLHGLLQQQQLGTSLLEVLASILIFSIGMLGYAAVQTRSLKESYDLQQRTIVLWQSQALIDRVRANKSAIDTYIGKVGYFNCDDQNSRPAKLCSDTRGEGEVSSCSSREIAEYDSWDVVCNNSGTTIDDKTVKSTPMELSVSLTCANGSGPCPPGEGLELIYSWSSRAALDDPQIGNSGENPAVSEASHPEQQQYRIEFMP
jgi:type IV pilus modification protein PilV